MPKKAFHLLHARRNFDSSTAVRGSQAPLLLLPFIQTTKPRNGLPAPLLTSQWSIRLLKLVVLCLFTQAWEYSTVEFPPHGGISLHSINKERLYKPLCSIKDNTIKEFSFLARLTNYEYHRRKARSSWTGNTARRERTALTRLTTFSIWNTIKEKVMHFLVFESTNASCGLLGVNHTRHREPAT